MKRKKIQWMVVLIPLFILAGCSAIPEEVEAQEEQNTYIPVTPEEEGNTYVSVTTEEEQNSDIPTLPQEEQGIYRRITAQEAKEMMIQEENYVLLDVRTVEEFKEGHIPGALLMPDTEIVHRASIALPDKNALILVYCRSGRRSENAARQLIEMGYTNIYDFGGIIDWPYGIILR